MLAVPGLETLGSNTVSGRITDIAVTPDQSHVFVLARGTCNELSQCDSLLYVFDRDLRTSLGMLTFNIPFEPRPFEIEVAGDGNAYLLADDASVFELNVQTLKMSFREKLPCCFGSMELTPEGDFAFFIGGDLGVARYIVRSLPGFGRVGSAEFRDEAPWKVFFLPGSQVALLIVRESCGAQLCSSRVLRVNFHDQSVQQAAPLPPIRILPQGDIDTSGSELFLLDHQRIHVVTLHDLVHHRSIDLAHDAMQLVAVDDWGSTSRGNEGGCHVGRSVVRPGSTLIICFASLGVLVARTTMRRTGRGGTAKETPITQSCRAFPFPSARPIAIG